MTTQTTTLTDFLLARYAEDEAAAKAAITNHETDTAGRWVIVSHPYEGSWPVPPDGDDIDSESDEVWAIHATRHDPARVLADVEAKRRIVAEHRPWDLDSAVACCRVCYNGDDSSSDYPVFPCPTLRLLALPFAAHPDYREEWKP